ncbi:MAG: hypothetical protein EA392_00510 [Cryomorphaceae bacterium]|nr:MAG: hypothetical protein EA392_00510 [Cryomorphaceae bacterium]
MQLSRKAIFKKSYSLVLSDLSEALLLLTGVLFMSFEDEQYLAATGLIDAALLCCLAYGFALTDSFQRFYARHFARNKSGNCSSQVLLKSVLHFAGIGVFLALVSFGSAAILSYLFSNATVQLFYEAAPWFAVLVTVYYFALPFHSFLIGKGHTRLVGWLALVAIVINALLLWLILHVWHWSMLPTNALLYAALVAESVWLILLVGFCQYKGYLSFIKEAAPKNNRLVKVIHKTAVYPGLSALSFHLGTTFLIVYLSWCCAEQHVATLTLILGFWGVLIAPVNGMADAANNDFSMLYSRRKNAAFAVVRMKYVEVAAVLSGLVFIQLLIVNELFAKAQQLDFNVMVLLGVLALLTIINKFDFVALLTRLENNSYAGVKLFYGTAVGLAVIGCTLLLNLELIMLLTAICVMQLFITQWLYWRVKKVWFSVG